MTWGYKKCEKCGNQQYRYDVESCEYCESKDCEGQDWPRCPHCFRPVEDWYEYYTGSGNGDGQSEEIECSECEKTFQSMMHVSYSFDSEKIVEEKEAAKSSQETE